MEVISILIADVQPLTKAGLKYLLSSKNDLRIVSEVASKQDLFTELRRQQPELLIIDYLFNALLQPADFDELMRANPGINILIISSDNDKASILHILEAGIRGFLTKECSEEEIFNAVYATARGEKYFCGKIFDILMDRHRLDKAPDADTAILTVREIEVLQLIAEGHTSLRIADQLNLSIHTINTHRKNIIRKLGIKSPTEFVIRAMDMGLISSKP